MTDNNLNLVFGTNDSHIILGTENDDLIQSWAGDDHITASEGNDIIFGGNGTDIYDYSNLSEDASIIVSLDLVFEPVTVTDSFGISVISRVEITVDKDILGQDLIVDTIGEIDLENSVEPIIGTIIAPLGGNNTFQADASSFGGSIDLSQNLYVFDGATRVDGSVEFTIENFVNAIGNETSDRLIGDSKNNQLDGQGGNDLLKGGAGSDTLIGAAGNDTLIGSSYLLQTTQATESNLGDVSLQDQESDVLTGGNGADLFILGDAERTFYQSYLEEDLAVIKDFTHEDKIQLSPNDTYSVQNSDGQLELFIIKETGTDLIAIITTDDTIGDTLPEDIFQIASGETWEIFIGAEV